MRYLPSRTLSDQALLSWGFPVTCWVRRLPAVLIAVMLIAGCSAMHPAPVESRSNAGPAPKGYYRVRPGDNLFRISLRRGLDYRAVARWNSIAPPYRLQVGRLLRVVPPGGAVAPASPKVAQRAPAAASPAVAAVAVKPSSTASSAQANEVVATKVRAQSPTQRAKGGLHWSWPLRGEVVQRFRAGDRTHQGIRIKGKAGEMVVAAAPGKVVYSGSGLKGYGNLIIVKHNSDYLSAYGFNRRLLVKEGEQVSRGQSLAELGQLSGGDYLLHFEIRKNGTAVDPLSYLPGSR